MERDNVYALFSVRNLVFFEFSVGDVRYSDHHAYHPRRQPRQHLCTSEPARRKKEKSRTRFHIYFTTSKQKPPAEPDCTSNCASHASMNIMVTDKLGK